MFTCTDVDTIFFYIKRVNKAKNDANLCHKNYLSFIRSWTLDQQSCVKNGTKGKDDFLITDG